MRTSSGQLVNNRMEKDVRVDQSCVVIRIHHEDPEESGLYCESLKSDGSMWREIDFKAGLESSEER